MNIRRLQGWALVVSAVFALLGLIGSDASIFRILGLVSAVLFILGVPAIHSVQPTGTTGLVGLILLELAAVIVIGISIMLMTGGSGANDAVILTSSFAGLLGRVIIGWLTTREKVFPAWVGWAFIVEGLFNFSGGLLGSLAPTFGAISLLAGAAALFGYGLVISRK